MQDVQREKWNGLGVTAGLPLRHGAGLSFTMVLSGESCWEARHNRCMLRTSHSVLGSPVISLMSKTRLHTHTTPSPQVGAVCVQPRAQLCISYCLNCIGSLSVCNTKVCNL
uniref:Uncharacterized protein n=1 Tax=Anguilla anguilla TaxID=7936 RepID=A0A0E9X667_ANGAN